jgi:hypothetical protein
MNHDHSADKENEKYTITYDMKLADKQKNQSMVYA